MLRSKIHPEEIMNRVCLSAFAAALLLACPAANSAQTATPNDAAWSRAVDLLPLIDPAKDAVKGEWKMAGGKLISDKSRQARIQFPFEPPVEYDFRIVFSCSEGVPSVAQYIAHSGCCVFWIMGGTASCSFPGIKSKHMEYNPKKFQTGGNLDLNRQYTSVLRVRDGGVASYLDGKLINRWTTDYTDVKAVSSWELPSDKFLAVGSDGTLTTFHKIDVLEIKGKGKVGAHPDVAAAKPEPGPAKTKVEEPLARVAGPADPETQKDARKFSRNQSSIKGLYVVHTETGLRVGSAQDIIATAERVGSNLETICDFTGEVAKDTQISMEEAERLLRVRYPVWQAGHKIRFSYANKYAKQAGGSAGGAFSVLLLSLLDGMQIDPAFAMTGDVTVDGKIREVGAVAEKIRGAALEKCRIVAIPLANKESLADLALLYSPAMLWNVQIFSIATLDEAAALARQDRPENLTKALALFADAQARLLPASQRTDLGPNATATALRNPQVNQLLREVLRLAPNHLSAEFMLRAANNQLAPTLTLETSLDEIWNATGALLPVLLNKDPDPTQFRRFKIAKISDETIKTASARLAWLHFRIHPKTRDLKLVITEYITTLTQMVNQPATISRQTFEQYLAKKEKVFGEATKIGTDRKALEELMH